MLRIKEDFMNIHSAARPTIRISVINASPNGTRATLKLRTSRPYQVGQPQNGNIDDEAMLSTMIEFGFMDNTPS